MSKSYISPNGSPIIGTSDVVSCRAEILGIEDDGSPEYRGEIEVFWDEQKTLEREGKILFLDEDGCEWTFDQLSVEEEEDTK